MKTEFENLGLARKTIVEPEPIKGRCTKIEKEG